MQILKPAILFTLLSIVYSCNPVLPVEPKEPGPDAANMGTFMDERDGKTYKTIKIGEQVWMAENLNYFSTEGSVYYNNDSVKNAAKIGRLYNWQTATSVAPVGWHLPTEEEINTLLTLMGGENETSFNKLKEGGSSGFNATLGGISTDKTFFEELNATGNFWSSTEYDENIITLTVINKPEFNHRFAGISSASPQNKYLSIRLIKDSTE